MKKTTKPTAALPRWAQLLLPLLVTLLCAGIVLLCSIRPYELAKTYLHVAFMDGSGTASTGGTSGLNIVRTDIDTNYSGATSEEGTPVVSDYGSQCAVLEAKSIDLYVPVYWGGGAELLEQGACQTPASALLGSSGNSVISGHVNTFFHDLSGLKPGDTVTAYTTYGKFTYEVTEEIAFDSSDKSYLKKTDDDRLTLYTCEMQLLGSSSKRVGVICKLTEKAFYDNADGSENSAAGTTAEGGSQ